MNRQKAIKKIIRKLNRVIGLHEASCGRDWYVEKVEPEHRELVQAQRELEAMIRKAVETDWEP